MTVEVEAPADGTLAGIRAAEGDDVPVGEPVAFVLAAGETLEETPAPRATATATAAGWKLLPREAAGERDDGIGRSALSSAAGWLPRRRAGLRRAGASTSRRWPARARTAQWSPRTSKRQPDRPSAVTCCHKERVVPVPSRSQGGGRPIEVSSVWRVMAERTTQSWQTVPHFYLRREVDATRLRSWRAVVKSRPDGHAVTVTDLLVKLVAESLRRHPRVNASWLDGTIAAGERVNVAIAVATDEALVAPVVHDADRLALPEIAARRAEIVSAAREGRLRPEDVSGGTFTISNLGMYGVDSFDAIVVSPQAAILAVGRIVDRLVPVDGQPAVRPMIGLSVSFDHRVVDGARGAQFLDTLASSSRSRRGW